MKIKLHPLFYLIAIYFVVIGKIALFSGYMISIILHENSHYLMAKCRNYKMQDMTLMPYGGKLNGFQFKNASDGILIALAGPIGNLIFAALLLALCWYFPSLYDRLIDLIRPSLALMFMNMLPLYPLDGSIVLFLLFKNKIRVAIILKICSYIFGILFILLTVLSIFYEFNITIAVFGLFIILSTYLDKDSMLCEYIYNKYVSKNK